MIMYNQISYSNLFEQIQLILGVPSNKDFHKIQCNETQYNVIESIAMKYNLMQFKNYQEKPKS